MVGTTRIGRDFISVLLCLFICSTIDRTQIFSSRSCVSSPISPPLSSFLSSFIKLATFTMTRSRVDRLRDSCIHTLWSSRARETEREWICILRSLQRRRTSISCLQRIYLLYTPFFQKRSRNEHRRRSFPRL